MDSDNFVEVQNYKIWVTHHIKNAKQSVKQDLTHYFQDLGIDLNDVHLSYFGDLDNDKKPDVIIQTCQDIGCHQLLFLSSEAKSGELLQLMSIHFEDGGE